MKASERATIILDKYPEIGEISRNNIINLFRMAEEHRASNGITLMGMGPCTAILFSAPHIMYAEQSYKPALPEEAYNELILLIRQVYDGTYKDIPDEYQHLIDKLKEKLDKVSISSESKDRIINAVEKGVRANHTPIDKTIMYQILLSLPLLLSNKGVEGDEVLAVAEQVREKVLSCGPECNSGDVSIPEDAEEAFKAALETKLLPDFRVFCDYMNKQRNTPYIRDDEKLYQDSYEEYKKTCKNAGVRPESYSHFRRVNKNLDGAFKKYE